jgi:hypothetical protein
MEPRMGEAFGLFVLGIAVVVAGLWKLKILKKL